VVLWRIRSNCTSRWSVEKNEALQRSNKGHSDCGVEIPLVGGLLPRPNLLHSICMTMDLFRRKKHDSSLLEQLDQIAASATGEVNAGAALDDCERSTITAIDALVDSDEDAEIFGDEEDEENEMENHSLEMPLSPNLAARTSPSKLMSSPAAPSTPMSPMRQTPGYTPNSEAMESLDATLSDADGEESRGEDDEDDNSKSGSASGEDYTDDEDEGEDGYRPGGYHPVKVGEIYNQRYVQMWSPSS
jgi:hypothetical protein